MAQYFYYILYNEIVALKLEISKGLIKNQILGFFLGHFYHRTGVKSHTYAVKMH